MEGGEFMGMDLSVFDDQSTIIDDSSESPEVTSEVTEEVTSPEPIEEVKYDDAWFTPPTFENSENEANWYKERFNDLRTNYNHLMVEQPQQQLQAAIEQQNNEIEGFKIAFNALKTNPEEFVMQYMPELLIKNGLSPVYSDEQILNKVHESLVKEFGEDYKMRYDPAELINIGSFSAQMLNRQNQLYSEMTELNKRNSDIMKSWNDKIIEQGTNFQTPEQQEINVKEIADKHYNEFEQLGFNREEYNSFIEAAQQQDLTMQDIHKVVYFDGYMQVAYEKGLEEGRKAIYNKLKSENNAVRQDSSQTVQSTPKPNNNFLSAVFDDVRIPMY